MKERKRSLSERVFFSVPTNRNKAEGKHTILSRSNGREIKLLIVIVLLEDNDDDIVPNESPPLNLLLVVGVARQQGRTMEHDLVILESSKDRGLTGCITYFKFSPPFTKKDERMSIFRHGGCSSTIWVAMASFSRADYDFSLVRPHTVYIQSCAVILPSQESNRFPKPMHEFVEGRCA